MINPDFPENLSFHRMHCRDTERMSTNGMTFHHIELAFQLEKGFLLFDGCNFRKETILSCDDFKDITHYLEPAPFYTIRQVGAGMPEREITLISGQRIRTGFTPDGYGNNYYQTVLILPEQEHPAQAPEITR